MRPSGRTETRAPLPKILAHAIRVVDPDQAWPEAFAAEKLRLETRLGGLMPEIHHVGSTSVAGLAAKPKIDIDAVLARGAAACRGRRADGTGPLLYLSRRSPRRRHLDVHGRARC